MDTNGHMPGGMVDVLEVIAVWQSFVGAIRVLTCGFTPVGVAQRGGVAPFLAQRCTARARSEFARPPVGYLGCRSSHRQHGAWERRPE